MENILGKWKRITNNEQHGNDRIYDEKTKANNLRPPYSPPQLPPPSEASSALSLFTLVTYIRYNQIPNRYILTSNLGSARYLRPGWGVVGGSKKVNLLTDGVEV